MPQMLMFTCFDHRPGDFEASSVAVPHTNEHLVWIDGEALSNVAAFHTESSPRLSTWKMKTFLRVTYFAACSCFTPRQKQKNQNFSAKIPTAKSGVKYVKVTLEQVIRRSAKRCLRKRNLIQHSSTRKAASAANLRYAPSFFFRYLAGEKNFTSEKVFINRQIKERGLIVPRLTCRANTNTQTSEWLRLLIKVKTRGKVDQRYIL